MRRIVSLLLGPVPLLVAAAFALGFPASAQAAFPGQNGRIAFSSDRDGDPDIYVMNPDGTGATRLTNNPGRDLDPAWSPEGSRIAFKTLRDEPNPGTCLSHTCNYEIYVMNADGTGQTRVTNNTGPDGSPAWSPDGTKLAYCKGSGVGSGVVAVANADGSAESVIASGCDPAWSPDGAEIAFDYFECFEGSCSGDIYRINPDGTNRTQMTFSNGGDYRSPNWSPDGSRVAFSCDAIICIIRRDTGALEGYISPADWDLFPAWSPDGGRIAFSRSQNSQPAEIYSVRPDSSGLTNLTNNSAYDSDPDWQPIPGYPRPQAGASFRVPLAIAYDECTSGAASRTHGPALTAPSCNPTISSSSYLTLGTSDANDKAAQSVGFLRYQVCVSGTTAGGQCSTPAGMSAPDVKLQFSQSDVRRKADLEDYTGELEVRTTLRITDKQNSPAPPGGASGTVSDLALTYVVPCVAAGPPDIGASCNLLSRINALIPGAAVAGKRAIWQLSQVEVLDGGADGVASTPGNTVFARQGVFIP